MTENNVAVCETDPAFLQAFASYLMEHIPNIAISSFSSVEAFVDCDQRFKVGIMGREFLGVQEFSNDRIQVEKKLYLCDEHIDEEYEHLPMVYKYQSMEVVEDMLKRILQSSQPAPRVRAYNASNSRVLGIYSPISHELSMPFALSLCQVLRESGSVVFLDIEELSILSRMTGQKNDRGLMDLLFMVSQEKEINLSDYVSSFMGVDMITPFANPEDLNEIHSDAWARLMDCLLSAGYDSIVVLFGRITQGFKQMVDLCDELLVLGKPGDYYLKAQENFLEYARNNCATTQAESVLLPMSASNLVDGTYAMEELIQGNLGLFVRRLIKEGKIAREDIYERAG